MCPAYRLQRNFLWASKNLTSKPEAPGIVNDRGLLFQCGAKRLGKYNFVFHNRSIIQPQARL